MMDLLGFKPTYVTFDCYGTLTKFAMNDAVVPMVSDRIAEEDMAAFCRDFRAYRMDEVIGEFKVYPQVLRDSWQRACNRWRIQFRHSDVETILAALESWGPHEDVTEGLNALAAHFPLVIISNAVDGILQSNVEKLGAPFHRVFTAEQARAYKPRYRPFEYMFQQLDADPSEILHVSAHIWYDVIPAHDLGVTHQVYVDRGYDPTLTFHDVPTTKDIPGIAGLLGI